MERVVQHIELSHFEIEQICREYFRDKGNLQHFEIISGGAVNTTFKILWDGKWFVLRFYVRDKNLCCIERKIYQLIQNRVPVPEMLFSSSENDFYPFAIFSFCSDRHIYKISREYSHNLSYDLGKTLSKIHSFHFPMAGLFGKELSINTPFKEGSSPYLEYCLKHLIPGSYTWNRLGETRANELRNFIEKQRDFFPIILNGGSLAHSDFKPVNLLWNNDRGLTVLDWEFAHSGHGLIDFGILLRHFQDFPLNILHLERAYIENGGKLPSDWIQRARITDFVNIVQLLNIQAERPKLFESLVESVDYTMNNWQKLQFDM